MRRDNMGGCKWRYSCPVFDKRRCCTKEIGDSLCVRFLIEAYNELKGKNYNEVKKIYDDQT